MNYIAYYTLLQNSAVRRIASVSRYELALLQALSILSEPTSYTTLYAVIQDTFGNMSHSTCIKALGNLVDDGFLSRRNVSISTIYELTIAGRKIVLLYNNTLEAMIKEYVLKYGNGL
jgi:predicted transcriptional regulator